MAYGQWVRSRVTQPQRSNHESALPSYFLWSGADQSIGVEAHCHSPTAGRSTMRCATQYEGYPEKYSYTGSDPKACDRVDVW